MIAVKNLHKYYKMKKGKTFHALKGLNIKFPNRGFVFVAGKSGCGKSTLLNVIGGLDSYEKGHLIVGGISTRKFTSEDMDNYRNSYLGFIFQDFHLIDGETIYENVALALKLQGVKKDEIPKRVKHYLKIVELYDKRNNKISEISGGQKQRVAIARALIKNPQVIIADEPTGNLDSKTGYMIMKILKKLSQTKLVIMVTHDLDYAEEFADRLIQLKDGVITSDEDYNKLDYAKGKRLRFKKSKFPLNVALKMAWTSVIRKKIRLVFTIILFAISIGLFSFTTSFNFYKTEELFYQYVIDTNTTKIQFSEGRNENWEFKNTLNEESVDVLRNRFPDITFGRIEYMSTFNLTECGYNQTLCNYQGQRAYVDDISNLGLEVVHGSIDLDTSSIIISDITADFIVNSSDYNSMNQLIGETVEELKENGVQITVTEGSITGIYRSNMLDKLKTYDQELQIGSFNDYQKLNQLRSNYTYLHEDMDIFVETYDISGRSNIEDYMYLSSAKENNAFSVGSIPKNENEVMFNTYYAINVSRMFLMQYVDSGDISDITMNNKLSKYEEAQNSICSFYTEDYNEADCEDVLNDLMIDMNNAFDIDGADFELVITPTSWNRQTFEETDLTPITLNRVTGISTGSSSAVLLPSVIDSYIEERTNNEGTYFLSEHNVIAILNGNANQHQTFIKLIAKEYNHQTEASMALNMIDTFLNRTVMRTFLIISLVLGGFASLFMYTYINQSIRFKRADIGTLRAIGAKGTDVGKIFITEAMIISLISSVFAVSGLAYVVIKLNQTVNTSLNLSFNFFYINGIVYIILLGFAAMVALVSCIIPLTKLVRMSPIDVIRKARD